jgi:hypothetical protein
MCALALFLLPLRPVAASDADTYDMLRMMGTMMGMWNVFSAATGLNEYGLNGSYGGLPAPQTWSGAVPWTARPGLGTSVPGYSGGSPALDGEWRSVDGAVLRLRGNRFSIYVGGNRLHGTFMLFRNRFIVYVAESDATLQFAFERRNDMFILQDGAGNMMLFKRRRPAFPSPRPVPLR